MPRRREIPKRELPPDPLYNSSLVTKFINTVMSDGKRSTAERILYQELRHHQGTHRRRSAEGLQEGHRQRQAEPRSEVAPRRRLELPGAGRSEPEPPAVAQHPLARRLRARRAATARRCRRSSPTSCSTRRTCAAARSRSAKTRTGWRKPTRRSRTTAGKQQTRQCRDEPQDRRTSERNAQANTAQQDPEHRHHGPHRCREDHDDRADPVLHRDYVQDRRSPRRHRRHGLDGAGAGARHHDHVRRDDLLLARSPHQHHRHARPRRLHGRSRALAARARRRGRRVRRGRRRRAAVGNRVAAGRQVPRAAHLLRQQDGPHRRGLHAARSSRSRPKLAGNPVADPAPDRRRGPVPRRHRPDRDEGHRLQGRDDGRRLRARGDPGRHAGRGAGVPREADREGQRVRRPAAREVPERRGDHRGRDQARRCARARSRRSRRQAADVRAGHLRLRLQEQGRAAAARRGRRLPAVAARHPAGRGPRSRRSKEATTIQRAGRPTTSRSPRSRSRS